MKSQHTVVLLLGVVIAVLTVGIFTSRISQAEPTSPYFDESGVLNARASLTANDSSNSGSIFDTLPAAILSADDQIGVVEPFHALLSTEDEIGVVPGSRASLTTVDQFDVEIDRFELVVDTAVDEADGECDSDCSLRDAINIANNLSASGLPALNITFDLPDGSFGIVAPDSFLPSVTGSGILIDGTGSAVSIVGISAGPAAGLFLSGDNNTLRGVQIRNFSSAGLVIDGDSNRAENVWLSDNGGFGALVRGSSNVITSHPSTGQPSVVVGNNLDGVRMQGASGNRLEETSIGVRFGIPDGNDRYGVVIQDAPDSQVSDNEVMNNGWGGVRIAGITSTNSQVRSNAISQNVGHGINTDDASESVFDQNTIEANTASGIVIVDSNQPPSNDFVTDNIISANGRHGLELVRSTGGFVFGNTITDNSVTGIILVDGDQHAVGGLSPANGNVITGNATTGVLFINTTDSQIAFNDIQQNGTDGVRITGVSDDALVDNNTVSNNSGHGVNTFQAVRTKISNNSIESNALSGVNILQSNASVPNTVVENNTISANELDGIALVESSGSAITKNTISGNTVNGIIAIRGGGHFIGTTLASSGNEITTNGAFGVKLNGSDNNFIHSNHIGTDLTGTQSLGNAAWGILLEQTSNNFVGGPGISSGGNDIADNGHGGILVTDPNNTQATASDNNNIVGNVIGTDPAIGGRQGNHGPGVRLELGSTLNKIGSSALAGNVIGLNDGPGVSIDNSSNNFVELNLIDGNGAEGVLVKDSSGTLIADNTIVSNSGTGVDIQGFTADSNNVIRNFVGTDENGTSGLGNGGTGISIALGTNNEIGTIQLGDGNVVASNALQGIRLDTTPGPNFIRGNIVGVAPDGVTPLGNGLTGIALDRAHNSIVGGFQFSSGNTVANNGGGILLTDQSQQGDGSSDNFVQGNFIGLNPDGEVPMGNIGAGIEISFGASNNTIGGISPLEGNVISDNGSDPNVFLADGILIRDAGTSSNTVLNNLIGTDAFGGGSYPNGNFGIFVVDSDSNTIGVPGAGNTIVDHGNLGGSVPNNDNVRIQGELADGNRLRSNVITGAGANGIRVFNAPNTVIGGPSLGEGNIISDNGTDGVLIQLPASVSTQVISNLIGFSADGLSHVPNGRFGVNFQEGPTNTTITARVPLAQHPLPVEGCANTDDVDQYIHTFLDDGDSITASCGSFIYEVNSGLVETELTDTVSLTVEAGSTVEIDETAPNLFEITNLSLAGSGVTVVAGAYEQAIAAGEVLTVITVDTSSDVDDDVCAADCSLREAIGIANSTPGDEIIVFDIPGDGPHTIAPLTQLPTTIGTVVINGFTQPGSADANGGTPAVVNVHIDGALSGVGTDGLRMGGNSNRVMGLSITGFDNAGIRIVSGDNSVIAGNYLGVLPDGVTQKANLWGIRMMAGTGHLVGGSSAADRNVISGNTLEGIDVRSSGNRIAGNRIGVDATGVFAAGNGSHGISVSGFDSNIIESNRVFYNARSGVQINTGGSNNIVRNNDFSFNQDGVQVTDSPDNVVGPNNDIVRNTRYGVYLLNLGATGTQVKGNRIGTDFRGSLTAGNGVTGVRIELVDGLTVGGTKPGDGNVISGNGVDGIFMWSATNTDIQGNLIGLNTTGDAAVPNGRHGMEIAQSSEIHIGVGAGNFISGNTGMAIRIRETATGTVIVNNVVGLNFAADATVGTFAVPNGGNAIHIEGASTLILDNVVSGNSTNGIVLFSDDNVVKGNRIGTDISGMFGIGNNGDGVRVYQADGNVIGGAGAGEGNLIADNKNNGIQISDLTGTEFGSHNTIVQGNIIGTDVTMTQPLGNVAHGVWVARGSTQTLIGGSGPGELNVIVANQFSGIQVCCGASDAQIIDNLIGYTPSGATLPNGILHVNFSDRAADVTITANVPAGAPDYTIAGCGSDEDPGSYIYGTLENGETINITCGSFIFSVVDGPFDVELNPGSTLSTPTGTQVRIDEDPRDFFKVGNDSSSVAASTAVYGAETQIVIEPGQEANLTVDGAGRTHVSNTGGGELAVALDDCFSLRLETGATVAFSEIAPGEFAVENLVGGTGNAVVEIAGVAVFVLQPGAVISLSKTGGDITVVPADETVEDKIELGDSEILVIGAGALVKGNVIGDSSNTVFIGDSVTIEGNLKNVGTVVLGDGVLIKGNVKEAEAVAVIANAEVGIGGNADTSTLRLHAGSRLEVGGNVTIEVLLQAHTDSELLLGGNLKCNGTATALVDGSAVIYADGNDSCM